MGSRLTNYVILKRHAFNTTIWEEFTASYARNGKEAIRMAAEGGGGPGVYRAVPAGHWRPPLIFPFPDPRRRPEDPNECQEGC